MIFLLIAGTYTPISLLALPAGIARIVLGVVWAGALPCRAETRTSRAADRPAHAG